MSVNQTIIPGKTFTLSVTYKNPDGSNFNFTDYDAKMQFRRNYGNTGIPLYESNTDNEDIIIDTENSTININISEDITALFNYNTVYELVLFSDNTQISLLDGIDVIAPGVTIISS